MERKQVFCERCYQSRDIYRDFTTGLWELSMGPVKISRLSWQALWDTWQEYHIRECVKEPIPAASAS